MNFTASQPRRAPIGTADGTRALATPPTARVVPHALSGGDAPATVTRAAERHRAEHPTEPDIKQRSGSGVDRPAGPGLPIPVLADPAAPAEMRCVVTPLDRDGRLADRSAVTFLGWQARHTVHLAIEPGPVIAARPGGDLPIDPRGHLHIPLAVRQACHIAAGDRVLLVADARRGELLVFPMATLYEVLAADRRPDHQVRR